MKHRGAICGWVGLGMGMDGGVKYMEHSANK